MQAFRNRKLHLAGLAGVSLTASALLIREIDASGVYGPAGTADTLIEDMRSNLPTPQADGSILEGVAFDGRKVSLEFVADERVDLHLLRDSERSKRCGVWRSAFRRGEVEEVEYRYRQGGAASSAHLNAANCG
ncbi:hypothetical protein [Aureimonas flava]|uniref:hypothetical protein n=1 Tax=Aureimonas flava TaxID=2320271 RepID=UPI0010A968B5|nr:hypothetical protein [Aureimonas flava]